MALSPIRLLHSPSELPFVTANGANDAPVPALAYRWFLTRAMFKSTMMRLHAIVTFQMNPAGGWTSTFAAIADQILALRLRQFPASER